MSAEWEATLGLLEADLDRAEALLVQAGATLTDTEADALAALVVARPRPATPLPAHLTARVATVLGRTTALQDAVAALRDGVARELDDRAARPRVPATTTRQVPAYVDARS